MHEYMYDFDNHNKAQESYCLKFSIIASPVVNIHKRYKEQEIVERYDRQLSLCLVPSRK